MPVTISGNGALSGVSPALSGFGKILQVVTANYATQVSTTSSTFVTTGLSATITPSSTANRIIAFATTTTFINTAAKTGAYRIFRGTVAGTQIGVSGEIYAGSTNISMPVTVTADDSPSTISAQTYTLGFKVDGGTCYAQNGNLNAVMILMEVAT